MKSQTLNQNPITGASNMKIVLLNNGGFDNNHDFPIEVEAAKITGYQPLVSISPKEAVRIGFYPSLEFSEDGLYFTLDEYFKGTMAEYQESLK